MSAEMIRQIGLALNGVEVQGDGTLVAQCCFPSEFCGFAGHFPGAPILPALVQLLLAREVIHRGAGNLSIGGVSAAKFKRPLKPLEEIEILCHPQPQGEAYMVELRVAGTRASSFNLNLRA
ncbi:hypothetical protein C2E25_06230 [Geothermobacter hydrogeniphilus]|uniref:ApeI dehydratase-like domain-containing protein n=1 Tax=Geothermobacter hydrogeniphilus TaxID=1969733 RepID=A0A2K2HBN6_9BACT|nr:hypothetical protein [Geothermobacter hydrogeniphilus]PNU20639.1 hypothetical protein C2E25_06230 [Geothermobacter hydrogeniphilus]